MVIEGQGGVRFLLFAGYDLGLSSFEIFFTNLDGVQGTFELVLTGLTITGSLLIFINYGVSVFTFVHKNRVL